MTEGEPAHDPVGTLAEETAKLFEALAGNAGAHGATGSAECEWCPVCRGVRAVRDISPEVLHHLTVAATSFAQAVSTFLEEVAPAPADEDEDAGEDAGAADPEQDI